MYAVKKGLLKRLSFQLFKLGRIIKKNNINIIYTMFGPGLNYRGVKSVTGCAYSNLFFPEIKFIFYSNTNHRIIENFERKFIFP